MKIKEIGPSFSGGQAKWDMSCMSPSYPSLLVRIDNPCVFSIKSTNSGMLVTYSATIPSCIAPGEYLLRIEQLGIHNPGSPPQVCKSDNVKWIDAESLNSSTFLARRLRLPVAAPRPSAQRLRSQATLSLQTVDTPPTFTTQTSRATLSQDLRLRLARQECSAWLGKR